MGFSGPLDTLTNSAINLDILKSAVEKDHIIPVIGVLFDFNSESINVHDETFLMEFLKYYSQLDTETRIVIEGFTCNLGSPEYNLNLSKRRANTIKEKLLSYGIPTDDIQIASYGKQKFFVLGELSKDQEVHRRSNITIFAKNEAI